MVAWLYPWMVWGATPVDPSFTKLSYYMQLELCRVLLTGGSLWGPDLLPDAFLSVVSTTDYKPKLLQLLKHKTTEHCFYGSESMFCKQCNSIFTWRYGPSLLNIIRNPMKHQGGVRIRVRARRARLIIIIIWLSAHSVAFAPASLWLHSAFWTTA